MAKYIIKESELKSAIRKIVAEELFRNQGWGWLGNKLINLAKFGAKSMISPASAAGDITRKLSNVTSGQEGLGIAKDLNDLVGQKSNNYYGGEKPKNNSSEKGGNSEDADAGNIYDIKKIYGVPEIKGNKQLKEKEPIVIEDFLGTGKKIVTKKPHYLEQNQNGPMSVFNQKLKELRSNVGGDANEGAFMLEVWLTKRDIAYEKYIKLV